MEINKPPLLKEPLNSMPIIDNKKNAKSNKVSPRNSLGIEGTFDSPNLKKQINPQMLSQATNDFMHQKSPQGDQNQARGNSKMKGLTIEQKMNYLEERASKNYLLYPHLYPKGKGAGTLDLVDLKQ